MCECVWGVGGWGCVIACAHNISRQCVITYRCNGSTGRRPPCTRAQSDPAGCTCSTSRAGCDRHGRGHREHRRGVRHGRRGRHGAVQRRQLGQAPGIRGRSGRRGYTCSKQLQTFFYSGVDAGRDVMLDFMSVLGKCDRCFRLCVCRTHIHRTAYEGPLLFVFFYILTSGNDRQIKTNLSIL